MDNRGYIYVRIVMVILSSVPTRAPGHVSAPGGFFLISNRPAVGRGETAFVYAIEGSGEDGEVEVTKEGGLSSIVINEESLSPFGCSLGIDEPNRFKGSRFGKYTATFSPADGGAALEGYTFVRPRSKLLDTRGVYTVTIYPEAEGSSSLASPVTIGVAWTPGCNKYTWCKDRRRGINKGPRFDLKDVGDAGLYTISRPGRSKRGKFVQILVIAASCPEGWYFNTMSQICVAALDFCQNGGVLKDYGITPRCICPPLFTDDDCSCVIVNPDNGIGGTFQLAENFPRSIACEDLPGGSVTCEGYLFCKGDNYGCRCASGWYGPTCDRPCPKSKWGASCEMRCPDEERDCSRFYGPNSLICE